MTTFSKKFGFGDFHRKNTSFSSRISRKQKMKATKSVLKNSTVIKTIVYQNGKGLIYAFFQKIRICTFYIFFCLQLLLTTTLRRATTTLRKCHKVYRNSTYLAPDRIALASPMASISLVIACWRRSKLAMRKSHWPWRSAL